MPYSQHNMDSPQSFKHQVLGHWTGGDSFSDYTEVDIFLRDDMYLLRRTNIMSGDVLEGPITWSSDSEFHTSLPLWTRVSSTEIRGIFRIFHGDLILHLEFENDGMAGADPRHVVELSQDENHCKKYRISNSDTVLTMSTRTFPPGFATDINLTPSQLSDAVKELLAQDSQEPNRRTDGIMLLRDGRLIAEAYQWGMDASSPHLVASVTKSIVGIVIGIAVDFGLISLSDTLSTAFPELASQTTWNIDPPITVHHALSMVSGIRFGDFETQNLLASSCVEEVVLSAPRVQNPGERFRYNNGLPTLLTVFLERKTGVSFEDFTEKHLFGPLSITQFRWSHLKQSAVDGKPLVLTSGGIFMTVPDLAKLGQLMLNGGVFDGKRVVSEAYLKKSVQQQTPMGFYSYGYMWHLNTELRHCGKWKDAYLALGAGENCICVIPSLKIVFVAVCSSWSWPTLTPPILEILRKAVLKNLDQGT